MELKGRNVIYVGGFGGIGYESCKCFLQQGIAQLFIFDVREDPDKMRKLQELNDKVYFYSLDLMNREAIEPAFRAARAQLQRIDILVNGSGIMNEHQIERTVGINLLGPIYSTLAALPYMDKSQGGHGGVIANISSMVGLDVYGGFAVYTAAKYGVNGFARAISDPYYYDKTKVAFVTICPGTTETPMLVGLRNERVTTFDTSPPLPQSLLNMQTAEQCACNLVKAVQLAKNGSYWILSNGKLREYVYPELS